MPKQIAGTLIGFATGFATTAAMFGLIRPLAGAIEIHAHLHSNPMLNGHTALENILAAMEQDGLLNQN